MKHAYVISGAGSGIGRSVALSLATLSEAPHLILLGRRLDALEETRSLLSCQSKDFVSILGVDLSDPSSLKSKLQKIDFSTIQLQGVIACAGIGGENAYGDSDRWDSIIATNLSGTYHLVSTLLPELKRNKKDYKHIIIIASILARIGVPKYSAYCASKAGLLGLSRSWAAEFASENILVNAICPGWVDTEMAREGIKTFSSSLGISFEESLKQQMSRVPLGKMSTPEEIASLVHYLLSNKQTSITGQAIDINNGAWMNS